MEMNDIVIPPKNFSDSIVRKDSFSLFPNASSRTAVALLNTQLTEKLVEAGFYYDPKEKSQDRTVCFSCKLALCDWEDSDDPFQVHYRRKSDCKYVLKLIEEVNLKLSLGKT